MSELVGYKLLDEDDQLISSWGGIIGQVPGIPNPIVLPNGDQVHAPSLDTDYNGYRLVQWFMDAPAPTVDDVWREKERRLALGFEYDFADTRGVHLIGTTPEDMLGWDEVNKFAQTLINLGQPESTITIMTETGVTQVTPTEWQQIMLAAAQFRQPIWAASFLIAAMDPIPADYTNDAYWSI